jgi:hypothetical protein
MDEGAEIVQLYSEPLDDEAAAQRYTWPQAALAAFIWSGRVGVLLLAGMQLRQLIGG